MSNEVGFNVGLVLPASGTGERMGLCRPKQFCDVLGRPLIIFTISTFHRVPWIQYIIVTVSESYKDVMEQLVADYHFHKVSIVVGGSTRHRSIYNGVKAVAHVCSNPDVVLIHDAVRIFAEEDLIKDIAVAAHNYGASGVTRPLISTVIASDSDGTLTESLDRNQYAASEMPQGFTYSIIKEAYEKSTDFDFDYGTECLLLAKKYCGVDAHIVEGKPYLWKVTHKKDLYAAEGMLKEQLLQVSIKCEGHQELVDSLKKHLLAVLGPQQVTQNKHESEEDKMSLWQPNTFIHLHPLSGSDGDDLHLTSPLSPTPKERLLLDHCHIHVLLADSPDISSLHHKVCVHVKQLAAKAKEQHMLMYAVLAQANSSVDDIAGMVKHVVFERSSQLAGQVFLV